MAKKATKPLTPLDQGAFPWLLAAALATAAPHASHLPLWLSVLGGLLLLWRAYLWQSNAPLPNRWLLALLVAAAGCLMVSNIKYYSFKDLDLKGRVPFVAILAVVLGFAVVFSDPPRILLLIFLAYAFSGPIQYLLQLRRRKSA